MKTATHPKEEILAETLIQLRRPGATVQDRTDNGVMDPCWPSMHGVTYRTDPLDWSRCNIGGSIEGHDPAPAKA